MAEPNADIPRLPDVSRLLVSSSPHVRTTEDVSHIMLWVCAALLPSCAAGVFLFGWRGLGVLTMSVAGCLFFETLFCRMRRRPLAWRDGSALVSGLLLGLNLPPGAPWWLCLLGALLAMGLGKWAFGGLGYNLFNPVLVARVGLLIAFPHLMTAWLAPMAEPFAFGVDAVTTATPLGMWRMEHTATLDYGTLFLGRTPGCIGETSELALLLGGLLLVARRLIRWQGPLAYIATVAVFTGATHALNPTLCPPPVFHLLSGGLFLGAIFMATDPVTTPLTGTGSALFGLGCGVITCVIRIWGGYPEGVSFVILFMNALTPLIDRLMTGAAFGARRKEIATP